MSDKNSLYPSRVADIDSRAKNVLSLLEFGGPAKLMTEAVSQTNRNRFNYIAKTWRSALENYQAKTGKLPSNALLASAHGALERLIGVKALKGCPQKISALLESASSDMSASGTGVDKLAHYAALYLPVLLNQQTASLASWVNCSDGWGRYEITAMDLVAAESFGAVTAGDLIGPHSPEFFGNLARVVSFDIQPDGKQTIFTHSTADKLPIKPGSVRISFNRLPISRFDDPFASGRASTFNLSGEFLQAIATINYEKGSISLDASGLKKPLPVGLLTVEYCIDDEALCRTDTVPQAALAMKTRPSVLKTSLIACEASVMAMFEAQRETGIDLLNTTTQAMIDLIASEADLARVKRLAFLTLNSGKMSLNAKTLDGEQFNREFARLFRQQSDQLASANGRTGATSIVAGAEAARWFMSHPQFTAYPDSRPGAVITMAGDIFGAALLVVPEKFTTSFAAAGDLFPLASGDFILVGNDGNGGAPMVAGDEIPPVPGAPFRHPISKSLKQRSTLLVQSLCDTNINGEKYSRRVTLDIVTA